MRGRACTVCGACRVATMLAVLQLRCHGSEMEPGVHHRYNPTTCRLLVDRTTGTEPHCTPVPAVGPVAPIHLIPRSLSVITCVCTAPTRTHGTTPALAVTPTAWHSCGALWYVHVGTCCACIRTERCINLRSPAPSPGSDAPPPTMLSHCCHVRILSDRTQAWRR